MRVAGILLIVALASACERDPSFDERYERAQEEIAQKSDELGQDLTKQEAGDGEFGGSESEQH